IPHALVPLPRPPNHDPNVRTLGTAASLLGCHRLSAVGARSDASGASYATASFSRFPRAGLPITVTPSPTSRTTTLPAPTVQPSPIFTPGITRDPAPMSVSLPTRT